MRHKTKKSDIVFIFNHTIDVCSSFCSCKTSERWNRFAICWWFNFTLLFLCLFAVSYVQSLSMKRTLALSDVQMLVNSFRVSLHVVFRIYITSPWEQTGRYADCVVILCTEGNQILIIVWRKNNSQLKIWDQDDLIRDGTNGTRK